MKRVAVLISGRGTNLAALLDSVDSGDLEAEIVVVVSNRSDAYGLIRAEQAGIENSVCRPADYGSRQAFDIGLAESVESHSPDLVVLAGWMLILGSSFLDHFVGRVINLHPALPGQFPGTGAIDRAYEAFKRGEINRTGVMVHHVIPEVDAGPVIIKETVPIHADDTESDLTARIREVEHRLIVEAVRRA